MSTFGDGSGDDDFSVEESLTELSELVGTAGLEVAGSTFQKVRKEVRACVCVFFLGGKTGAVGYGWVGWVGWVVDNVGLFMYLSVDY